MEMNVKLIDFSPRYESFLAYVARVSTGFDFATYENPRRREYSPQANENTLLTLCQLKHESVFEFASLTFWVTCPIFVARQLMRYRCASYIERSGRRTEPLPIQEKENETDAEKAARIKYNTCLSFYKTLIENGIAKENARRVLTLEEPTQYLFKCNLREFLHICDERLRKDAQLETRILVSGMYEKARRCFPVVVDWYKDEYEWEVIE